MDREGFRQKDVRFLLGLFLNWVDSTVKNVEESVHNTQISRYLDGLVRGGFASVKTGAGRKRYQLGRAGMLELVGRITRVPVQAPLEQFFFAHYFVKTYRARLTELVAAKENRLPRSLQLELEALLDPEEMRTQQLRAVQLEIRKLESRIQETLGAAALSAKLEKEGTAVEEMVRAVEQKFPYDLNNAKPMSELFHEVPPHLRGWELTVGNRNRAEILWGPMRDYLRDYAEILKDL
jgi:hypothetical protein